LRLFSFGGYGLALAALVLVVFGAYDRYPARMFPPRILCPLLHICLYRNRENLKTAFRVSPVALAAFCGVLLAVSYPLNNVKSSDSAQERPLYAPLSCSLEGFYILSTLEYRARFIFSNRNYEEIVAGLPLCLETIPGN